MGLTCFEACHSEQCLQLASVYHSTNPDVNQQPRCMWALVLCMETSSKGVLTARGVDALVGFLHQPHHRGHGRRSHRRRPRCRLPCPRRPAIGVGLPNTCCGVSLQDCRPSISCLICNTCVACLSSIPDNHSVPIFFAANADSYGDSVSMKRLVV